MSTIIPQKSSFKLDEVCEITGVRPYVLRFWETEFAEISPLSTSSGQKVYEHKDIEAILKLKGLLVDENLSMEETKSILEGKEVKTLESFVENVHDFSDKEIQKLVLAKAKLQSLISKLGLVEKRFYSV